MKTRFIVLAAISLIVAGRNAQAGAMETLTTPSYKITIEGCEEGVVSCDSVKYTGISKKTGKFIKLTGRTVHSPARDGITPGHFLGYEFKNGKTTYFVAENGELRVTQGTKVVVVEKGEWDWERSARTQE